MEQLMSVFKIPVVGPVLYLSIPFAGVASLASGFYLLYRLFILLGT